MSASASASVEKVPGELGGGGGVGGSVGRYLTFVEGKGRAAWLVDWRYLHLERYVAVIS